MFYEFDIYINKDTIEVGGEIFKLGELTCDILNIKPDEYSDMSDLAKQIEKAPTQEDVQKLYDLLSKRKLFNLIDTYPDVIFSEKYVSIVGDIYAFNQTMSWFIKDRLMKMDKLSPTEYANELWNFYTHPRLEK